MAPGMQTAVNQVRKMEFCKAAITSSICYETKKHVSLRPLDPSKVSPHTAVARPEFADVLIKETEMNTCSVKPKIRNRSG